MGKLELGRFIAQHRRALSLTQEQLAEKTGLSTGYIGNLEAGGVALPRKATRDRLADALRVHVNEIVAAAGVTEPEDESDDLSMERIEAEMRRIAAIPMVEDRMDALKRLSPAVYDLVEGMAFDLLRRAARPPGQSSTQAPKGEHSDRRSTF